MFYAGCLNGGGQIELEGESSKDGLQQVEKLYNSLKAEIPEENRTVTELYEQWLGGTESEKAGKALHTEYHAVEKISTGFNIKWWRLMLDADLWSPDELSAF